MPQEFAGTERFRVLRRLGAGGIGVVYEVLDQESGDRVALKTLQRTDARNIFRFKREFRALADLSHPNLVKLFELVANGEMWFFTMELVEGTNFFNYIRAAPPRHLPAMSHLLPPDWAERTAPLSQSETASIDTGRLRDALYQLAEGVHVLHQAGKLHRDLKPGNVLVTPENRVVILDFGLVSELPRDGEQRSLEDAVVGTPEYMAPEQGFSQPLTPAADWYAVGVMLYEVLVGRPPFRGKPLEVILAKQNSEIWSPGTVATGVPADLDALCLGLLQKRPEDRPSGEDILRRLRAPTSRPLPSPPFIKPRKTHLVGRAPQVEELARALASSRGGRPVLVRLHGPSGQGKTALLGHFLQGAQKLGEAMVIAGRCYEQESMPYKALDPLVDELSSQLRRLAAADINALLPRDIQPLLRLFPVLTRVPAMAEAPRPGFNIPNPRELQQRGVCALKELLARIADRRPLLLAIDDAQWGDQDSATVLAELLQPPDAPSLLLVLSYRSDDADASPMLSFLGQTDAEYAPPEIDLALEPLDQAEAQQLALQLLEDKSPERAAEIARGSQGNPFLVYELARAVLEGAEEGLPLLEEMLQKRLRRLPEGAQRVLELLAVASAPLDQRIALVASELPSGELSVLDVLKQAHLIRMRAAGSAHALEIYHDRIREVVLAGLDEKSRCKAHAQLAQALESSAGADLEELAFHLRQAGETARAAGYAVRAAERAFEALAFERAAQLFGLAVELGGEGGPRRCELLCSMATAAANAGRGVDAAKAYLLAADDAEPARRMELQRLAADQLFRNGRIDEGLQLVKGVLQAAGLKLHGSPKSSVAAMLADRLRLRLGGLRFQLRRESEVPPELLRRVDVCWSTFVGASSFDVLRTVEFGSRYVRLALRAGEPNRLVRALALEAFQLTAGGGRGRRRSQALLQASEEVGRHIDDAKALAYQKSITGLVLAAQGQYRRTVELCDQAVQLFRERCVGVSWEIGIAQRTALLALGWIGEFEELGRRIDAELSEARRREDRLVEVDRLSWRSLIHMAADAPQRARADLEEADAKLPPGYSLSHFVRFILECYLDGYAGPPDAASKLIEKEWPRASKSLLLRVQLARITLWYRRAAAALQAAAGGMQPRARLIRTAAADASRIEQERMAWSNPIASLIRAGAANLDGRRSDAVSLLERASKELEAVDLLMYAAAARLCHASLLAGEPAEQLKAVAEGFLQRQGVRSCRRFAAMLVPGFTYLEEEA